MRFYPFHVGDYAAHTQHLDEIEDLAYRRMLDYVYLNEINLPESVDEIGRLIRMRTHCERIANVLREFFTLENGEWINNRAKIEIDKYNEKSDKAKQSASKRWKKDDANAMRTQCERNANQEPRTKNQEPINKKQNTVRAKARDDVLDKLLSAGLTDQQARDFISQRNAQRAPATITTIDRISKQAVKAGISTADAILMCLERGWRGFNASWVTQSAVDKQGARKNMVGFVETHTDKSWADGL